MVRPCVPFAASVGAGGTKLGVGELSPAPTLGLEFPPMFLEVKGERRSLAGSR